MAGEFDFVAWVKAQQSTNKFVLTAAGDDLAVLKWDAKDLLLVGADQVLEGRHFDRARHDPEAIGRKVANRNFSDCAAMGCMPAALVVTVALPKGVGLEYAQRLYSGLKAAASPHHCGIVGGDTGSWDGPLALSVTVLGRSTGVTPVLRTGAAVGEGIYVTGPLGGSILGRHMTFEPRLAWGRQLATYRPTGLPCIKAMIDVSDGLSRDLRHLLAESDLHPQLGAKLASADIPIHPDALALATQSGRPPIEHALHDGEDHELLFTSPVRPPVGIRIGTVTENPAVLLDGEPLPVQGWEHSL